MKMQEEKAQIKESQRLHKRAALSENLLYTNICILYTYKYMHIFYKCVVCFWLYIYVWEPFLIWNVSMISITLSIENCVLHVVVCSTICTVIDMFFSFPSSLLLSFSKERRKKLSFFLLSRLDFHIDWRRLAQRNSLVLSHSHSHSLAFLHFHSPIPQKYLFLACLVLFQYFASRTNVRARERER